MQENSYLIIAPQIRGLAAKSGYRVQVQFHHSVDGEKTNENDHGFSCSLPEVADAAPPEDQRSVWASSLAQAWATNVQAGTLPSIIRVEGLGCFKIQTEATVQPDSRNDVIRGKVAVVTGGAQGFGAEITRGLIAHGAFVVVADLNLAGAQNLVDELNFQAAQEVALAVTVNVADENSVSHMVDSIVAKVGGIDLFIANAGVLKAMPVLEQDLASFELVTAVNYTGYMLCVKHAARIMREQARTCPTVWSDIIQINSKSGLAGSNKNGAYAGSKFGGIGLTQSFALELVAYGIKVNSICPGNFFDGPLWSDPTSGLFAQYLRTGKVPGAKTIADIRSFYESKVPMNRGCRGPDVLKAILYIVEQDYETGQAVPVTGGQTMLN